MSVVLFPAFCFFLVIFFFFHFGLDKNISCYEGLLDWRWFSPWHNSQIRILGKKNMFVNLNENLTSLVLFNCITRKNLNKNQVRETHFEDQIVTYNIFGPSSRIFQWQSVNTRHLCIKYSKYKIKRSIS